MKANQLIIIGGGDSISDGIKEGLWKKIHGRFVMGLNYSYLFFPDSTFHCFVDDKFYTANKYKDKLEKLPLIVGQEKQFKKLPNTELLKCHYKYTRDMRKGVYKASLVGLFGLTLGIHLLDVGEIFLLGYDFGERRTKDHTKFMRSAIELHKVMVKDSSGRARTHFYQGKVKHRGIGKITYYNSKDRAEHDFGVYKDEKKVKIYNVSLISKIPDDLFEKIDYQGFFKKLDSKHFNQEALRTVIKSKIKEIQVI